jgi:predicted transcriptional regulator
MQQIIPLTQLISRAKSLGLSQNVLARRSNMAVSTVCRLFLRGTCNSGTLEKLSAVVLAEEAKMMAHLENLHPQSEHGHGEAE